MIVYWIILASLVSALIAVPAVMVSHIRKPQTEKKRHLYAPTERLLTKNEHAFFKALVKACPEYYVCPKVRLADLVHVAKGNTGGWYQAFAKISQKHIDFTLCHIRSMKPAACIELDDPSHASEDAKKRDAQKNAACSSAGIKLIRFATQREYKSGNIKKILQKYGI